MVKKTLLSSWFSVAALGLALASLSGCGPQAPAADVPTPLRHIAEVHKARCGNCHVRVEPGTHTRDALEAAFPKHRTRVRLTDEEWTQMIEYLAPRTDKAG
jgi:hypothetical protein